MKSFLRQFAMLGFILTLLFSVSARADSFDFSYVGAGVNASGTLTTGAFDSNIGGFGIGGWQITGITGLRNGLNIDGIVPNVAFPNATNNGAFLFDNALISDFSLGFLDNNGLLFTVAGSTYNIFSQGNPYGGGYYEYTYDNGIYNPIEFTASRAQGVPDGASTAMMVGFATVGLMFTKKRTLLGIA